MSMRYPGGLIASSPVNAAYPSGVWTQAQTQPYAAQNVWMRDQFWPNTTLLLQGNGTNGAQNNTFLDSSTNNFTITRNGNTTQGSFTPYEANGYWSNYFDGASSLDFVSSTNATNFGTGDFTVEFWVYLPSVTSQQNLIDNLGGAQNSIYQLGGALYWYVGANRITATGALSPNVWQHIALCRASGTTRLFVNGTQVGSNYSDSNNYAGGTTFPRIGAAFNGTVPTTGYISNVRFLKGTALYTSAFTPSAAPLTAITNTSLLACQSNRFIDNSTNAFAVTVNGTPSVQAFQPFPGATTWSGSVLGGSGYFDGSGDYLVLPDNAALEPGSSNLTWETWINTTNSTQYATLYSRTTASFSTGMWSLMMNVASSTTGDVALYVGDFNALSPLLQTTGVSVRDGAWHHIAVVRNGSAWTIYVDGVSRATATWAGTIADISGGPYIGRDQFYGRDYTGYMTDLRVLKGTAQYTAAFTPPSAPLTAVTNTSLLANFTNAGILDNAEMNNLETVGNAQISTAQSKFGGGSIAFDGTGDYLTFPANNTLQFGTGDFTIEFWTYLNSVTGFQMFIDNRNSTSSTAAYITIYSSGTSLIFYTTGNDRITATSALSTGAWLHIAVSKSSGSTKMFVNGSQVGSTYSDANSYLAASTPQYIASRVSAADFNLNGYIDDLRITNGYARYTANFTAPTAPFPLS